MLQSADHDAALAAARTIADLARANAADSERMRRQAAPVVDAFHASGLAALLLPTALGGHAAHPGTVVEVVETIATGDASAGWCAGIGMGSNFIASVLDPTAAKSLFTDPTRGGLGIFMPGGAVARGADGLRLNGRWNFASNCHQATVASVGVMRMTDTGPEMTPDGTPVVNLAFISRQDFEIDETWDMAGMRGTGSHDIVATDVGIDEAYIADLLGPKWPDDPLFRLRMFDMLVPCLSSVALGIGRAALTAVREHVEEHGADVQRGPKPPFGVDVAGQIKIGQADVRLRAARALVLDALDDAYNSALRGDPPERETSALIQLAGHEGLAAANNAVDTACRVLGTSASREGALLDRLRRDVVSAGAHVMFNPANAAPLGRQLTGMHTVAPPFLPPE